MDRQTVQSILHRVFADAHRLVDVLQEAESASAAVDAVAAAFELPREHAAMVLDQQLRLLVPATLRANDPAPD
ncbi:MAG TPA: hypothetical protein VFW21_15345 [Mycobacterium sp.]|nr:hypothetical protein [Mycobacterium sp.]